MRTFCARSRAYDNDVIQLFWPFADFTQPIKLQKTLNKLDSKHVQKSFGNCVFDTVSNLVFWSRFVNKLEPWHIVYIMQQ